MVECSQCGRTTDEGVVLGTPDTVPVCNECRAEQLSADTTLSGAAAKVAALSQFGESKAAIATALDMDRQRVDRLCAEIRSERAAAARTLEMLETRMDLDRIATEESVGHLQSEVETLERTVRELGTSK